MTDSGNRVPFLAQRLWDALQEHGDLITFEQASTQDIYAGLELGWLCKVRGDRFQSTTELRRVIGVG